MSADRDFSVEAIEARLFERGQPHMPEIRRAIAEEIAALAAAIPQPAVGTSRDLPAGHKALLGHAVAGMHEISASAPAPAAFPLDAEQIVRLIAVAVAEIANASRPHGAREVSASPIAIRMGKIAGVPLTIQEVSPGWPCLAPYQPSPGEAGTPSAACMADQAREAADPEASSLQSTQRPER